MAEENNKSASELGIECILIAHGIPLTEEIKQNIPTLFALLGDAISAGNASAGGFNF